MYEQINQIGATRFGLPIHSIVTGYSSIPCNNLHDVKIIVQKILFLLILNRLAEPSKPCPTAAE